MKSEAFIFFHCSYGILRVIKTEDKLYYSLADIIRLFQLTPLETFNAIADSAGGSEAVLCKWQDCKGRLRV